MFPGKVFYHGIIRSTIVAFGNLFSNIYIDRREGNSVTGTLTQRIQVPIAYGPKEKWLVRTEQDPNLENHTYVSLPRLSFEIVGYNYDSLRKTQKMQKIQCRTESGATSVYSPTPYNIDIALYVLTKTQEDALQIIEQILPTFTPEYTISIRSVQSMNIVQDIPITLDNITATDDYEGDFQTRRFVIHTLTFTLKTNLYGPVQTGKPIYDVTANINNIDTDKTWASYNAVADPETYQITSENWTFE